WVGISARWSIRMGILLHQRDCRRSLLCQHRTISLRFWTTILRPRPHPAFMVGLFIQ
ncbi:hypothetical protein KI387_041124, partial [Taxus chinensis]